MDANRVSRVGWVGTGAGPGRDRRRGLGRVGGGGRAEPGEGAGAGRAGRPRHDPVEQLDRCRIRPYQTGTIFYSDIAAALTISKLENACQCCGGATRPGVGVVPLAT